MKWIHGTMCSIQYLLPFLMNILLQQNNIILLNNLITSRPLFPVGPVGIPCCLSMYMYHQHQREAVFKYSVANMTELHWNLDLTNCQGTREIGSLYPGSVPYILKGWAGEYCSLYRGLCYNIEVH